MKRNNYNMKLVAILNVKKRNFDIKGVSFHEQSWTLNFDLGMLINLTQYFKVHNDATNGFSNNLLTHKSQGLHLVLIMLLAMESLN